MLTSRHAGDPKAHGSVELIRVDFQDYPRGLHLTDIGGSLSADGDRWGAEPGGAGRPGKDYRQGSLGLSGAMPLSLKVEAHNARPLASDLITTNIDMDLSVRDRCGRSSMLPAPCTSFAPT